MSVFVLFDHKRSLREQPPEKSTARPANVCGWTFLTLVYGCVVECPFYYSACWSRCGRVCEGAMFLAEDGKP